MRDGVTAELDVRTESVSMYENESGGCGGALLHDHVS
jgi:hypothetical protein